MDLDQLPRGMAMQFDTGEIVYPAKGPPIERPYSYNGSGLRTFGKTADFLRDPRFQSAHARGWQANPRREGAIDDNRWIVHVALWAASHAARLQGDFVECGVNTGMMSLAICEYLDFNSLDRDFWLFDTYAGIPDEQMSPEERAGIAAWHNRHSYTECYAEVVKAFAPWPRAWPIRGTVPESLADFSPDRRVAYLSIDMNIVLPEIAALEFFWPVLVPSAVVLLDDYAWETHRAQKAAFDAFAAAHDTSILSLPTGQGLIIR
jgi:hypothetical protein